MCPVYTRVCRLSTCPVPPIFLRSVYACVSRPVRPIFLLMRPVYACLHICPVRPIFLLCYALMPLLKRCISRRPLYNVTQADILI